MSKGRQNFDYKIKSYVVRDFLMGKTIHYLKMWSKMLKTWQDNK